MPGTRRAANHYPNYLNYPTYPKSQQLPAKLQGLIAS